MRAEISLNPSPGGGVADHSLPRKVPGWNVILKGNVDDVDRIVCKSFCNNLIQIIGVLK